MFTFFSWGMTAALVAAVIARFLPAVQ